MTLEQADRKVYSEDCADTIPVFEAAIAAAPDDGLSALRLGYCRYRLGRFEHGLAAFRRAETVSSYRREALYWIGSMQALLGNTDEAIEALNRYAELGKGKNDQNGFRLLQASNFESLRDDPRFDDVVRAMVGDGYQPDGPAEWKPESVAAGVAEVMEVIEQRHPDPYRYYSAEEFRRAAKSLVSRSSSLTLEAYALELMRLVARIGDIHTSVWVRFDSDLLSSSLPLLLWRFADGLYVRAAPTEYEHLVGARVLNIGRFDVEAGWDELVERNPRENEWMATGWLQFLLLLPDFHVAEGWADDPAQAALRVEMPDGTRQTVTVEPTPGDHFGGALEASSSFQTPKGWIEAAPTPPDLPLWLQARGENYWTTTIPDPRTVYMAVNHPKYDREEWRVFLDRVFSEIHSTKASRLVVDLRHNTGGYDYIAQELIHRVIRSDAVNYPGGLCVITSRTSQSAGVTFAALFERETPAIIVGEPVGGAPNYYNGPQGFFSPKAIPGAPLRIRHSSTREFYSDPKDNRRAIGPDIWTPMSFSQFAKGEDPALEACLGLDEKTARAFLSDAGGREFPLYLHWRRPSQAPMFPGGELPRRY